VGVVLWSVFLAWRGRGSSKICAAGGLKLAVLLHRDAEGVRRPVPHGTKHGGLDIDRAVAAYQDFVQVEGWAGNLAIHIEHEFFGIQGPSATFKDRYGREGRSVRGLSVEEHLVRLRENLLPLAERYGRVLSSALASLDAVRLAPSQAIERSRPTKISVRFE
jgi:hypothetical protein